MNKIGRRVRQHTEETDEPAPVPPAFNVSTRSGAGERLMNVVLPAMDTVGVVLVGTAPLLVHAWSQKNINIMLGKQTKAARGKKEPKDPEQDFHDSRYISKLGWDGIPAGGLRACFIDSARYMDDLAMRTLQGAIFIRADDQFHRPPLVRLYGDEAEIDEQPVRLSGAMGSSTDIRHRARYENWALFLHVSFMRNIISMDQLGTLIATAGISNGQCEHRPSSPRSKTGQMGTFRIGSDQDADDYGINLGEAPPEPTRNGRIGAQRKAQRSRAMAG